MKELKNTRFIYISTLGYCNVFITQVIDWLHAYQEKGIIFEIWRISSLKKLLLSHQKEIDETKLVRGIYKGTVRKLYFAPALYLIDFIFDTFLLLYSVIPDLVKRKNIIIQIRTSYLWRSLRFIKMISPGRVRIIFDSRAAVTEELLYSYSNKGNNFKKKIFIASTNERMMIEISDKVFCVSNVLIEYHLRKNPLTARSKYYLYPCCADSSHFYYSPEFRSQVRGQYNLENRKVIVYSGGLETPWHIPSKIFELFSGLHANDENYFLIVLSPDTGIAEKYMDKFAITKDSALIISVSNSEVVKYLCASDIALLLRDDVPMNNVASPSKFAEYIMTGLPVIISQNVGDFSDFVKKNDLGYVFNNDFSINNILQIHSYFDKKYGLYYKRRVNIAELGLEKYSKASNIDEIVNQYISLMP